MKPAGKPSKSALFEAAKRWDAASVTALLEAAPALASATDPKGRMALHIACAVPPAPGLGETNGIATVTALLKGGADLAAEVPMPAEEGDFRANPVWYAASRGENVPLVKFLLRRGGDASFSLWTAVFRDKAELMRALLAARPRLNLRAHGETPIFYAARLQPEDPGSADQGRRRSAHQGRSRAGCGRYREGAAAAERSDCTAGTAATRSA